MTLESIKNQRWVRRALWAIAVVLVVWALAWAVLPGLLQSQLSRLASEQLGREVRIGAVHLRPWSLELTLEDLAVAGAPGAVPLLTVQRIYIDAELQSLLRLAPVVDALEVDGLALRLKHMGGGHYDIDDLLTRWLAPAEPPQSATGLPRFALYNVAVRSASVDFVDQGAGQTHEVRDLQLSVPFLSNLGAKREVLTEPRLSFRLNGSRFDSSAQTTPFASTRKTDAAFKLADLNLQPYLPYLPPGLPVKLLAGVVGGDVRVHFEQTPQPVVRLSGSVDLKGLALADPQGQDLLSLQTLRVDMADVRPLEQVVQLAAVELTGPRLEVRRDRAGVLNLLKLAQAGGSKANAEEGSARAAEQPVRSAAWQVAVAKVAVRAGQVRWSDAAVQPAARLALNDVALEATGLALPWRQPAVFNGSLRLAQGSANGAAAAQAGARLGFKGEASEQAGAVNAELQDLSLALAAPYAAQFLQPALAGRLDAEVAVQWKDGQWQLRLPSMVARQLTLGAPSRTARGTASGFPLAIQRLEIREAEVRPSERSVTMGQIAIRQPAVTVERDQDGRWMFERWLRTEAAATGAAATTTPPARAASSTSVAKPQMAWRVLVADAALDGGQVRYADRAHSRPVVLDVTALSLQAKNFASNSAKLQPVKLSAQVRARRGEPGRLSFNGALALQPLSVRGQLQATDLPAQALSPYLGDVLNVALVRADAGFKGQVRYAQTLRGVTLHLQGDALLEDLLAHTVAVAGRTQDVPVGEELLSWKALSLRGLDVALQPGQATRVSVAETALSDFYARVLINESGRINLQDIVKSKVAEAPVAAPPVPAAAATVVEPTPAPVIAMGPVSLVNGRVEFSDRFIKPNYSARLTELTGRLSAFASQSPGGAEPGAAPPMADLELRGRAEGTATIEILGKLNPLAQPLALDITGKMKDLELSPLSPYSVKYAGHGIERGKLSMDVAYKVDPDGRLVASNKLVLNQLTFGDAVEGAPNSLPVRLAVALLADRDGVIDINLPISGSLNDPEFSVGAIVWKMIVNLVAKAITAPFALLASAFDGGDEELGTVPFAPGSAELSATAQAGLDKVAQAMKARAGLTMTVAGTASLEAERDGYKRERLAALILAEKRRAAVVAGQPAESVTSVTAAERPALLRQVYRRAQIAKPRNLLGLTKELPPAEMEALLLASIPATEEHMRELALARGVAVRDYLSTRELPLDRLFLGAAKAEAADARWVPHAELSLTMK